MTSDDNAGQDTRTRTRALLHDLHDLGRLDGRAEAFGHELRARLLSQAPHQTAQQEERNPQMAPTLSHPRTAIPRRSWPIRRRLASIAAAALLVLSGIAGYLHWQAPTPVSAHTVLRHAAAALQLATAEQVTHDISIVRVANAPGVSAGVAGLTAPVVTVDEWTQRAANDVIERQDLTFTDPHGTLLQRIVQNGHTLAISNAQETTTMTVTPSLPPPHQIIPDPFDTASLRQFVLDAQAGTNQEAQLLPQQTIAGRPVYVVHVTHTLPADPQVNAAVTPHRYTVTLYIDQGTYAIRSLQMTSVNSAGALLSSTTMQVVRHNLVPVSAVPTRVFSLHAPAHAQGGTAPHTP